MTDARFTAIANAFNYGGPSTPAVPAKPSSAQVAIGNLGEGSDFSNFSGTFAGLNVNNLNLSGVTTWQGLAATLQSAFRQADGNSKNISVTLNGLNLVFSDSKGRGSASNMTFTPDPENSGPAPTASAPMDIVAGAPAQAATGGPAVSSPSFIKTVVQMYTEAQFQAVVGNTSNTLREALYAQQELPSITNWYSIIANRPLANVIQTVLGLPDSFGAMNVDHQAQLSSRMNIANFQNPRETHRAAKSIRLHQSELRRAHRAIERPAIIEWGQLNGVIINVTIPNASLSDSLSSGSAAALLQA